jgi:hypothetical protein
MSDFRPLSQSELSRLSPEELIAYHHEARRLFRHDEARTALGILIWGFQDRVRYWVSRTVPSHVDLIDRYLRVLRETTNWLCDESRRPGPIGRLLAAAAKASDDLTVITFNHDLVIENEIYRRALLRRRWCLDAGYGSISSRMENFSPLARLPVFPRDGHCDHTHPIRLLKLHGSLNWVVRINSRRPTRRVLAGSGSAVKLLVKRQITTGRDVFVRSDGGRGRSRWNLWPVVVPPVYAKGAFRAGAMQDVWTDASRALERADRVVFYGYSLPGIDIEAEKLFERSMTKNGAAPRVDVVNPAPASAARFAGVAGGRPLRWYPTAGSFLNTDALS